MMTIGESSTFRRNVFVCVGDVCTEVHEYTSSHAHPRTVVNVGGSTYYNCITMQALGTRVLCLTSAAPHDRDYLRHECRGVDLEYITDSNDTTTLHYTYTESNTRVELSSQCLPFKSLHIDTIDTAINRHIRPRYGPETSASELEMQNQLDRRLIPRVPILMITNSHRGCIDVSLIKQLRSRCDLFALDVSGMTRMTTRNEFMEISTTLEDLPEHSKKELFGLFDFIKLQDHELHLLTGTSDIESGLSRMYSWMTGPTEWKVLDPVPTQSRHIVMMTSSHRISVYDGNSTYSEHLDDGDAHLVIGRGNMCAAAFLHAYQSNLQNVCDATKFAANVGNREFF